MGEVYRGRDTRLESRRRDQGPAEEFTSDREPVARFEREAWVLAALNHPHIGAIFGIEEGEGFARWYSNWWKAPPWLIA